LMKRCLETQPGHPSMGRRNETIAITETYMPVKQIDNV